MRKTKKLLAVGIIVVLVLAGMPATTGYKTISSPKPNEAGEEKTITGNKSLIYIEALVPEELSQVRCSGFLFRLLLASLFGIYIDIDLLELDFKKYNFSKIFINGRYQQLEAPFKVKIKNFYGFGTRLGSSFILIFPFRLVGIGDITISRENNRMAMQQAFISHFA